jgi:glycosyltransferase involved in cell wall biosynthesis
MRIAMLLDLPFPPDVRVEKEAKALANAGFEVVLMARSRHPGEPERERTAYGLAVSRTGSSPPWWERGLGGDAWPGSYWRRPLGEFLGEFRPDVLHVHDLPLVSCALRAARGSGVSVVADLHENMPAAFRVWCAGRGPLRRLRDSVARNYHVWRWHERRLLLRCDRVIVVVPEAAERLRRRGVPEERIVVVSNTEDDTTFPPRPPDPEIVARYRDEWVVSYVGGGGIHRGLDTAIGALPAVAREVPHVKLLLVGVGEKRDLAPLARLAARSGVQERLEIVGWQPPEKVGSYVAASAVCLVPHKVSEHTQTTVPHKLFQYMVAGKPVVVSDLRPLTRIVRETRAGLVFTAGDPAALARCLLRLHADPALQARLGKNGRRASLTSYSWRHDARRLVGLYQGLRPAGAAVA